MPVHSESAAKQSASRPHFCGEMLDRIEAMDWSASPLGSRDKWPQTLRIALNICLHSRFPMFVWWGPRLINLYNDAYIPILGQRHPAALGRSAPELWPEIWATVGPEVRAVVEGGQASWNEYVPLMIERNGAPEEVRFTWSHSPIIDEEGRIGGVLCVVNEETPRWRAEQAARESERRLRRQVADFETLLDLLPVGIGLALDRECTQIRTNRSFAKTLALSEGSNASKTAPDDQRPRHFRVMDDDGREIPGDQLPMQTAAREGRPLNGVELNIVHADGRAVRLLEYAAPLFDEFGVSRGSVAAFIDITARRIAEARDRFLVALDDAVRPLVDPQEITLAAARSLGEHLKVDRCAYADVEADQDTMNLTGNYTRHSGVRSIVGRLRFGDFGAEVLQLMREDKAYVVNDVDAHQPPVGDPAAYRATQIQAVICVPLHKQGRLVAAMGVHAMTPRVWRADEVELLRIVANRCWESIERARVARTLRDSEERYRTFVAQSAEGIWRYEAEQPISVDLPVEVQVERMYADAYLAECNDAFAKMYGYESAAELTGIRLADLQDPSDERNWAAVRALVESGYRLNDVETIERDRDGRERVIRNNMLGIVENGRLTRVWGTQRDVTDLRVAERALRESERRFRGFAENLADVLWITTTQRPPKLLFVNPAFERVWGRPADFLYEDLARFRDTLHVDDRKANATGVERVADGPFTVEYRVVRPDGAIIHIRDRGFPVYDDDGRLAYVAGIAEDVTAEKQATEALQRVVAAERAARAEAERAGRMKDEFLATLSHELRTPLNAILGWSQLIEHGGHGEADVREGLSVIARNARMQTQLIEDLLDMSRITSGTIRLDVRRVDLMKVISAAAESVQPAAAAKGIAIQIAACASADAVAGDPARLQQIVWNLLSNSVKFTPRGGTVHVSLEWRDAHVEISVVDTGQGIRAEFLPYVFDRFRQADASTTRRQGGLGIGLALVKQLVELHGGSVHAASEGDGRGAAFTVRLPVAGNIENMAPLKPAQAAPQSPPAPGVSLRGVKVLVIDDEPDARTLARRVLESGEAQVFTAADAEDGFATFRRERPDVVLSDIGMPIHDGYEFIDWVRRLNREEGGRTPAAAFTAFARAEDRHRALLAGYQSHLAKPVDASELIAVVAALAGRTHRGSD